MRTQLLCLALPLSTAQAHPNPGGIGIGSTATEGFELIGHIPLRRVYLEPRGAIMMSSFDGPTGPGTAYRVQGGLDFRGVFFRNDRIDISSGTGLVYRAILADTGEAMSVDHHLGLRVTAGVAVRVASWTSLALDLPFEMLTFRDLGAEAPRVAISPRFSPRLVWSLWFGKNAKAWKQPTKRGAGTDTRNHPSPEPR